MRYRGTIYIDVYADSRDEAENELSEIVLGLKGSFLGEVIPAPHGSKLNLIGEAAPGSHSLISGGSYSLDAPPPPFLLKRGINNGS